MKLLKIKDNTQQKKDLFSNISTLTSKIADKTLEQLEREGVFVFPEIIDKAEDITRDQMIIQSVNDTFRSGNVMGFLGYGDERLIIESRFSCKSGDYFFQYLLGQVLEPNILNLKTDANPDDRFFNFLLFLFPHILKSAMRKGIFKIYIRHCYMPESDLNSIVSKYVEMNIAHPFMEGNGRSTRIWLDLILKKNLSLCVDWSKIDKKDYLTAMEKSPVDDSLIFGLIEKALTDKINDREIFIKGIDYSYYYESEE